MRPSFQILAALMVLGLAGVSFWFGATGIFDGAVEFPSKREHFQVLQAVSPKAFWACVAVWLAMGVGFSWLAVSNFREAVRRA
jgi:hypothetical protein